MQIHHPIFLMLAFAGACTAKDAESGSTSASTGEAASSGTTTDAGADTTTTTGTSGDTTGPVTPTTGTSGDEDPSTSTVASSLGTTEDRPELTTESSDTPGGECASSCGVLIECERLDVDESLGAPPCAEGFHCVDASECGCPVTFCAVDCDPNDPRPCLAGEVCDARTGECVPA